MRSSLAIDHGALRVLIVASPQCASQGESPIFTLANALCDSGHIVDLIDDKRAPTLDGRIRFIKLQDTVRIGRRQTIGDLLKALSARARAERQLSDCLAHIVKERAADYDLVIDDQTLLDEMFAFKARGVKVFSLITRPHSIERSSRKTIRALDGVLVPSQAIAEEVVQELKAPRTLIEVLDSRRRASTIARLYARAGGRA
ncbi:MAG TPA: hypothetical protein VEH07_10620 [Alphaproteobacteria bacterium]|nr:hypothetical protein [Alphaproteobacteria bacterium]